VTGPWRPLPRTLAPTLPPSLALALALALALGTGMAMGCGPTGSSDSDAGGSPHDASPGLDSQVGRDASGIDLDGGGSDALAGCDPKNFVLQQAPPGEVYLVVDRSGSMSEPGATPGQTKWQELTAAVDAALTQYASVIRFGLLTYPADDQCATTGPQVGLAPDNRVAIMTHLADAVPAGGTPTAAALNNAAASMTALGDPTSPKYIILATDGGPNCNYFLSADPGCSCTYATPEWCCTSHPDQCLFGYTCLDDQHTLEVVNDLRQNQGIDTFVIGLEGTAEYVNLLNALAVSGGRPQVGGSTDYYPAANQTELLNALQTIAVGLISCEIQLEEPPDFPDLVTIYMDGQEVPRDPAQQDGWDYTDAQNTTIELFGAACDTLQDGAQHTLTATFACVVD
jgi:hypothetical protein